MRCVLLIGLLATAACVDDLTVVGDERAAAACASAELVAVPSTGCTTVRVLSSGPYGCLPAFGGGSVAGSWVRVAGTPGAGTIEVHAVEPSATCAADGGTGDGGPSECATRIYLTSGDGVPCECDFRAFMFEDLGGGIHATLPAPEAQVLLLPFGATFDVTVCRSGP